MQILSVELTTSRLAEQRHYYAAQLGLPLTLDQPGRFAVLVGRSTLAFRAVEHAPPIAHLAITIPSAQYEAGAAWLAAHTPLLAAPDGRTRFHFERWGADAVYFLDADGNILELIARHELPDPPVEPFGVGALLCISEVGLVLDDVVGFAEQARRDLGLEAYRAAPHPDFTAVGDAHGLLILARRGRPWMPDERAPAADPPIALRGIDASGAPFQIAGPPYQIAARVAAGDML
jgi:catechol-2,3-dioxygenase